MYFGPKKLVRPTSLKLYEETNKYIIEPKIDGIWAELTIGPNKLISKNGNYINTNLLDGINTTHFPRKMHGIKLLCEVETETHWATINRKNRGYAILWIHTLVLDSNRLYKDVPYLENKKRLQELYNDINPELRKKIYLMPYAENQFDQHYGEYKEEYCPEGCILKNKMVGLVGANSNGKSDNWLKVKDFPHT